MGKIPFSQLWIEEEEYLFNTAKKLNNGTLIVEIGTAQGGSSLIFAKGAKGKDIEIYSYDISPSEEAYEYLKGTGVKIISQSSVEGAENWGRAHKKNIDLLFIDGSHTLLSVINDFKYWAPFLSSKSQIIFHDYDPVERGGYPHLGVKVAVGTIINTGVFENYVHLGRLLAGYVKHIPKLSIPDEAYSTTWKSIGSNIMDILDKKYRECFLIGSISKTLKIILELLNIKKTIHNYKKLQDLNEKKAILLFIRPLTDEAKALLSKQKKNVLFLDDLKIFYLFYWAMKNFPDRILTNVCDRNRYFKFQEQIEMLEHFSRIYTIENIFNYSGTKNINSLSAIIAREVIRTTFLSEIIRSIEGN